MNRENKTALVERLKANLEDVPSVVVTDFQGLKVAESDELRRLLDAAGCKFEVVKNTLVKRAIAGTSMEGLNDLFKGNSAIAYHPEEPGTAAKLLLKFAKDHNKLVVKGGWVEGTVLDLNGVEGLSKMPSKDEMRAKLLNVMKGVPTAFVRVLNGAPTKFLQVLQARKMQIEGGDAQAA